MFFSRQIDIRLYNLQNTVLHLLKNYKLFHPYFYISTGELQKDNIQLKMDFLNPEISASEQHFHLKTA